MRIAVTGARGLVGSRLCLELWARGHEVIGLLRGPTPPAYPPSVAQSRRPPFGYRLCDLTDGRAVEGILAEAKPEVIIHTASTTHLALSDRNPHQAYAHNAQPTAHSRPA